MPSLKIDKWNGGLSTGDRVGVAGSFYYGHGLDYITNPDQITANLSMVKDSDDTVVDLIHWGVYNKYGDKMYFYSEGGKIYERTSAGAWSLLRTVASSSGNGFDIFNNYLYYTQDGQIGRYGPLDGAAAFEDDWNTDWTTSQPWRPIKNFLGNLALFGDASKVSTVDTAATFTANELVLHPEYRVVDIEVLGEYACIAANNETSVASSTEGMVYFWNGVAENYNFSVEIKEGGGINCLKAYQDVLYIFAGNSGYVYMYTGRANKVKKIPFINPGKTTTLFPGAATVQEGQLHFGISGGTSTNVYRGVYTYGQPNKNYPMSLNFGYPLSTGNTQGTTVQVGCLAGYRTNQFFASWEDDGTYGVDLLSSTLLQTSVEYQSRIMSFDNEVSISKFRIYVDTLASGETVTLTYQLDRTGSWSSIGTLSYATDGAINYKLFDFENARIRATEIQIKAVLAGSTSAMPALNKIMMDYDGKTMPLLPVKGKMQSKINLKATSTGKTTSTYDSDVISFNTDVGLSKVKLFFEKLVGGDSLAITADVDRAGTFAKTISTITQAADGSITSKVITPESDIRCTEIQFRIVAVGTSAVPVIDRMVIQTEEEGVL